MTVEPTGVRLALRVEGKFWNAYVAKADTMEGAFQIGSIAMAAVENREIKHAFMNLMQQVIADALKSRGITTEWPFDPQPAPESERAGNA